MLKNILHRNMSGKNLTPEVLEKNSSQTKSPIPHRKSQMANALEGEGREGFDTSANNIQQQNGWRAVIMWWFSRPKSGISRLKIRQ